MKPDIPHMDDHVSKLHAVGAMTQQKLQDIRGACEAASIAINVPLPQNCITKGADLAIVLLAILITLNSQIRCHAQLRVASGVGIAGAKQALMHVCT